MRMYKAIILVAILALLQACKEQPNEETKDSNPHLITGGLQWMSIDDLARNKDVGSKKYLIDVYTEWCGWCKVMDKKTFTDPRVQKILKESFNIVKFDAERKDPILYKRKTYEWKAGGRKGNNELAIHLLDGKMSFPSLVYLDEKMNKIRISPGYKNPEQLIQELEVITKS